MKQLIYIIFTLLCFNTPVTAQTKLSVILDSLSTSKKEVKISLHNNKTYFQNLQQKKNFGFAGYNIVYINSFNHFSIFGFFDKKTTKELNIGSWCNCLSNLILFDHKENRCFNLFYGFPRHFGKKDRRTLIVDSYVFNRIKGIVELDGFFNPITGFNLLYLNMEIEPREDGLKENDIISQTLYYQKGNEWYKQTRKLSYPYLNIENITYNEFLELLSIPKESFDDYCEEKCTNQDFMPINWLTQWS